MDIPNILGRCTTINDISRSNAGYTLLDNLESNDYSSDNQNISPFDGEFSSSMNGI